MRQRLAEAEALQLSRSSALQLLAYLDATAEFSPLHDANVSRDELRQALRQHAGYLPPAAQEEGLAAASESRGPWPAYQLRLDLEEPDRRQSPAAGACPQGTASAGAALLVAFRFPDWAFDPAASKVLPVHWTHSALSKFPQLVPGTYKLLLTFEPSSGTKLGLDAAAPHAAEDRRHRVSRESRLERGLPGVRRPLG